MTESLPSHDASPAALEPSVTAQAPEGVAAPAAPGNARPGRRGRSGPARQAPDRAQAPAKPDRAPRRTHPLLELLAGLYPALFGAHFRPLKRGVFQDLQTAHPGQFEKDDLKLALGIHTRSTRYLQSVASGEQRHDLQGQPVEAVAPEHVFQALAELYRRRKPREGEDRDGWLRKRLVHAFEASGLSRDAYVDVAHAKDELVNALRDEALSEAAARLAKAEALRRTFEASGQTVEAFAEMYGMDRRAVAQALARTAPGPVPAEAASAPAA